MSEKCKTILRPKVRFSQDSTDSSDSTKLFHGPKLIKNITLGKPINFVHGISDQDLRKIRKNEVSSVLRNAENTRPPVHPVTSAPTNTNADKNPQKHITISASVPEFQQNRAGKSSAMTKASMTRQTCSRTRLTSNKENNTQPMKKANPPKLEDDKNPKNHPPTRLKPTPTSSQPIASKKFPVPPRKQSTNVPPISKTLPARVQNCRKSVPAPRAKPQVKTEIVRNVSGPKPAVYVGRGMVKGPPKVPTVSEVVSSTSTDKTLARPEYNSIIQTIKQLKIAQNDKIITDVGHLPLKYKNLVMKKVSSALDFPVGQAIYRDLIDLSVDETRIPQPVTRSKDPEPRKKDIEPVLSDFFVPQYDEEYAQAVKVRSLTPEIHEDWNPFEISKKIFEWKSRLDDD